MWFLVNTFNIVLIEMNETVRRALSCTLQADSFLSDIDTCIYGTLFIVFINTDDKWNMGTEQEGTTQPFLDTLLQQIAGSYLLAL